MGAKKSITTVAKENTCLALRPNLFCTGTVTIRHIQNTPSRPPHDKYGYFCFFVDYAIGNAAEDRG